MKIPQNQNKMTTRLKLLAGPAAPDALPLPKKGVWAVTPRQEVTTAGTTAGVVTPVKAAAGGEGAAVTDPDIVCQFVELELQLQINNPILFLAVPSVIRSTSSNWPGPSWICLLQRA